MTASPLPNHLIDLPSVPRDAGVSVISPASFANRTALSTAWRNFASSALRHVSAQKPQRAARSSSPEPPSSVSLTCMPLLPTLKRSIVACVRGGYGSNYLLDGLELRFDSQKPQALLRL